MRDVLVRLVNERYDDALAALACPVELVWGDDDTEAPLEAARALGRRHRPTGAAHAVCPGRRPPARPSTAPGRSSRAAVRHGPWRAAA